MTANEAFDAGVSALGRDDHPTAIANLLVARDAAPRDTEITAALEAARSASESRVHVDAPLPIATTDLALLLVLVNAALCVCLALRVRRALLRACFAAWAVALAGWLTRGVTQRHYVVISAAEAASHAADDDASLERYRLKRGDELVLLESRDGWLKVDGPEGPAYVAAKDALQTTHLGDDSHR